MTEITECALTKHTQIRFLPMEETDIESVKENLRRTLGSAA